ncbi:MAG: hypothetical protein JNM00_12755, partial [Flavobacteriales bacterium]|nr:hypothetical protein [Flavobacteriales bacterium]
IYAQHYNSEGVALWEANGRSIIDEPGNIAFYDVMRDASTGEIFIGWVHDPVSFSDALKFQKLDENGAKVWASDLLVAQSTACSPPHYILYIPNFQIVKSGTNCVVSLEATYCGGANGHRITRFDSAGNLIGPFQGEPEGNQYYSGSPGLGATYDGSGESYLWYSDGNGAGAHARCLRVTLGGDTAWGPVDVLAGTNGLSWQFRGLSDETGAAFCFVTSGGANGTDIYLRKLNSDGSWAWGGATTTICNLSGNQDIFYIDQDDDYYYVSWADSRPGAVLNAAIYAQKVDKATGNIMWAANGVQVFSQNTYIPYAEFALTPAGEMIICNEASIHPYFNAQKVNPDGTLAWASTVQLADANYSPFYGDYMVIRSGTNMIAVWADSNPGGGADGIYIGLITQLPDPCPEDLNGDGSVNTTDLLLFMGAFGCNSSCGPEDLNGDGAVNTTDLLLFMGAFGTVCP